MTLVFVVGVLASADVIDLPGDGAEARPRRDRDPGPALPPGPLPQEPEAPAAAARALALRSRRRRARRSREARWRSARSSTSSAAALPETCTGDRLRHAHRALERADPASDRPQPRAGGAYDGKLYLAGGYLEGDEPTSNFWEYDPRNSEWTKLPPMGRPRGRAAAAVIGDKLYVADGAPQTYGVSNPSGPYESFEIYDFGSGRWSSGPDAPVAVHHVSATALDGDFYMAGGRTDPEASSDEFVRYDPAAESWTRLPNLPAGAYSSVGIVTAGGKVVVFGGDDELGWKDGGGSVTASAWAFDPQGEGWHRLPDLTIERHAFGAAATGDRVYALGGSYCPGLKPNGPVATHTVESLPVSALRES